MAKQQPEWKKAYNKALKKYEEDRNIYLAAQNSIQEYLQETKDAGAADAVCKSITKFLDHSTANDKNVRIMVKDTFHDRMDECSFPKDMLYNFLSYVQFGINQKIRAVTMGLSELYRIQHPTQPKEEDFKPAEDVPENWNEPEM